MQGPPPSCQKYPGIASRSWTRNDYVRIVDLRGQAKYYHDEELQLINIFSYFVRSFFSFFLLSSLFFYSGDTDGFHINKINPIAEAYLNQINF